MRILCVCLGNICRSPTAEAVLRQLGGLKIEVDSAGTGDWHIGKPPYGPAMEVARRRGYEMSTLRARQVEAADFNAFNLILAMDRENKLALEALRPEGNTTPVELFLSHAPQASETDVPDPYFTRDFERALDLIECGAKGLLSKLAH